MHLNHASFFRTAVTSIYQPERSEQTNPLSFAINKKYIDHIERISWNFPQFFNWKTIDISVEKNQLRGILYYESLKVGVDWTEVFVCIYKPHEK